MWLNKIIYAIITLYAGVLAILYARVQMLYVFIALICFPMILLIVLYYNRKKLRVQLQSNVTIANIGEEIKGRLVIENTSFLPIASIKAIIEFENMYLKRVEKQVIQFGVLGKSTQKIGFQFDSTHTGVIRVQIERSRMYDYLRLFSIRLKQEESMEIKILPELYDTGEYTSGSRNDWIQSNEYSKVKAGDDSSEVFSIREYRPGDKLHRVHWKVSSKRDEILVKEYSLPIIHTVAIFVELSYEQEPGNLAEYMDAFLAAINAMSYTLLLNHCPHCISWYDTLKQERKTIQIQELEELYGGIEQLLEANIYTNPNAVLQTHSLKQIGSQCATIYYMATSITEEQLKELCQKYGGRSISCILICSTVRQEEVEQSEFEYNGVSISIQYVWVEQKQQSIEALRL